MKKLIMIIAVLGFVSAAQSEETMGEKVKATAQDTKRAAKKAVNRTKEVFCAEGDAKCLAKKAKHRVEEGTDYVKDKASETKESIDSK